MVRASLRYACGAAHPVSRPYGLPRPVVVARATSRSSGTGARQPDLRRGGLTESPPRLRAEPHPVLLHGAGRGIGPPRRHTGSGAPSPGRVVARHDPGICGYGILPFGGADWGTAFQNDLPLVVVAGKAFVVLTTSGEATGRGSTLACTRWPSVVSSRYGPPASRRSPTLPPSGSGSWWSSSRESSWRPSRCSASLRRPRTHLCRDHATSLILGESSRDRVARAGTYHHHRLHPGVA